MRTATLAKVLVIMGPLIAIAGLALGGTTSLATVAILMVVAGGAMAAIGLAHYIMNPMRRKA